MKYDIYLCVKFYKKIGTNFHSSRPPTWPMLYSRHGKKRKMNQTDEDIAQARYINAFCESESPRSIEAIYITHRN